MRDIVKQPEEQIVHRISMNASEEKWALDCSQNGRGRRTIKVILWTFTACITMLTVS